jgi:putative ABC transport system permease protein
MFDLDKWQEIFATIKKNKLRTVLTGFSVAWGIFMLIILLGSGRGLENGFIHQFRTSATNAIWIWGGRTSVAHNGLTPGRTVRFNNQDYERIVDHVNNLEYASGRFNIWWGSEINYKNETHSFGIRNVHPDYGHIEKVDMVEGRFVNQIDISESRKVVVISTQVRDALFKNGDQAHVIGTYININKIPFKVVGVFIDDDGRDDNMRTVYVPISTAQIAFSGANRLHQLVVTVNATTVEQTQQVEQEIRQQLAAAHSFQADDQRAVGTFNSFEQFNNILNVSKGIRLFIWIIGIGTIIAGIVGVSNIMLIVVKERTKEIGVRKALGATPSSVIGLVMLESVIITTFAGYIGLVLGVGILELMSGIESDFFLHPHADIRIAISATVVLVISGALAGLYPARKAASIKPIEALRDE